LNRREQRTLLGNRLSGFGRAVGLIWVGSEPEKGWLPKKDGLAYPYPTLSSLSCLEVESLALTRLLG